MIRVVFNQKGGVGKTSISCNLAGSLAKQGHRVLLIDLDSQSNGSQYLMGHDFNQDLKTIYDFFSATVATHVFRDVLRECVHPSPYNNLWIIPSSKGLVDIQAKLESRYKVFKLKKALDTLISQRNFTQVIIDTPPALNFFSMSALIAAQQVLVPFDCDRFSEDAIDYVEKIIGEIREDYNPDLQLEGIVINQFQNQANLPKELVSNLIKKGYPVLKPYIPSSVIVRESHQVQRPLCYYKPSHKISEMFSQLAKKLAPQKKTVATRKPLKKNRKTPSSSDLSL